MNNNGNRLNTAILNNLQITSYIVIILKILGGRFKEFEPITITAKKCTATNATTAG